MNLQQIKLCLQQSLVTNCQCCGLSHNAQHLFCDDCCSAILKSTTCIACGNAIPIATCLCGSCLKNPPVYDALIAVGNYQYPLKQLVSSFKYHQKTVLARPLAELLAKQISRQYQQNNKSLPSLIIPVPLHHKRELSRGYNQSGLIGKILEDILGIPCNQTQLFRTIDTPSQAGLSRKQRQNNLANAFICQELTDKHVALVDDVVTTASTVTQICKVLKKSGAKQVDVWCICRTVY